MGLSGFQMLAIGGGKAAEVIRETENKRKDGIKNALFKSIEDSVAPAAEYRQKHLLVKNKAKEDIESLISTYFANETMTGVELSRPQQVAAAQALYSKYGYNREKVDASYQNKFIASKKLGSDSFNTLAFLNSEFQSLKNIDSNMDLDTVTSILAQNKVGAAPRGFDTSMQLIKAMPTTSSILTDPIDVDKVASRTKETLGLPKVAEGELPIVPVKPIYDHNKVIDEVQKYKMNEVTIRKNEASLKDSDKWRNLYKDNANAAVAASTLDYKLIPNSAGGFDFRMPGGEKNIEVRREVERQSLKNFVMLARGAGKIQDSNFLAIVQSVGANVTGLGNPGSGKKLIPGMTYKRNDGTRIVYTGQKDAKGEFINIELLSTTPTYK